MKIKIYTIAFDATRGIFEDKDMQEFMLNKKILSCRSHFFEQGGKAYWTILLEYDEIVEKANASMMLSEPERLLYEKLQEWRKEKATTEGVPVYIIATNTELAEIVRRSPRTLDGLRGIKGFGNKKTDKYGKELLQLISAFYERQVEKKSLLTGKKYFVPPRPENSGRGTKYQGIEIFF